ncbi:MAG: phosphoribosylaminoimidazolecarboxamide formyltransferase [Sphaerochaeta sp.]
MEGINLKYGCNPNQGQAALLMESGAMPLHVLNGEAGFINLLDALNAWQLVNELTNITSFPSATSFKHVSPAGVGLAYDLTEDEVRVFDAPKNLSPLATAYLRSRNSDPLASYGDIVALSGECDESVAELLKREVSDGVIAPAFSPKALSILKQKKGGRYLIMQIDPSFEPALMERRTLYGMTLTQERNIIELDASLLTNIVTAKNTLPPSVVIDLLLGLITLKYTQSNSVCFSKNGQALGIGAGQQSRIACTRLAGDKADLFHLRFHPKLQEYKRDAKMSRQAWNIALEEGMRNYTILTQEEQDEYLSTIDGVSLTSDAFFPFKDNIDRAAKSGVRYIAQSGGSTRDDEVIASCNEHSIVMALTGVRLFHH